MNEATAAYWAQFLQQYPNAELYEAFSFAHTRELADELGSYVVNGTKTATCSAKVLYDKLGDPLPQVGMYSIVLNGDEQPIAIIETTEVTIVPMNEVSEAFAVAEGEGTYDDWWRGHVAYFSETLPQHGEAFSDDMLLVCERFKRVK